MAVSKAEIRAMSIVLLGDFNPIIFQPRWFVSEELITQLEGEDAAVEIVHPDVTIFQLPWLGVNVSRDRAMFSCSAQPYFERVTGVASQTFELLRHTPIRMLGLNNEAHIRATSEEKWHSLGHSLAPKDFWNEFLSKPGMQNLTIRQIPREDGFKGHTEVSLQPSTRVDPGVFTRINEHFIVADPETIGADAAVTLIRDKWQSSTEFAERFFAKVETLL